MLHNNIKVRNLQLAHNCVLQVVCPELMLVGLDTYFSKSQHTVDGAPYRKLFIFPDQPSALGKMQELGSSPCYRTDWFGKGYYAGHYFGEPAVLERTVDGDFVLIAHEIGLVTWRYIVKLMLTEYAIEKGYLHLKAAAMEWDGNGYLLIGASGAGKTTLLWSMVAQGAKLVSNTHCLVDGETRRVWGVHSNVRMRDSVPNDGVVARIGSESMVDPGVVLGAENLSSGVGVRGILFLRAKNRNSMGIEPLQDGRAGVLMEYLSYGLNYYDLHQDIIVDSDLELSEFAEIIERSRIELQKLLASVDKLDCKIDARREEDVKMLMERLK